MIKVSYRQMLGILTICGLLLAGCTENEAVNWEASLTSTKDHMTLYGTAD